MGVPVVAPRLLMEGVWYLGMNSEARTNRRSATAHRDRLTSGLDVIPDSSNSREGSVGIENTVVTVTKLALGKPSPAAQPNAPDLGLTQLRPTLPIIGLTCVPRLLYGL